MKLVLKSPSEVTFSDVIVSNPGMENKCQGAQSKGLPHKGVRQRLMHTGHAHPHR